MIVHKPPKFLESSFTCPHCGTSAEMHWLHVHRYGPVAIGKVISSIFPEDEIAVAQCRDCEQLSVWINRQMVYPDTNGVQPSPDMPEQAKKTFCEAQSILNRSPRGACMLLRLCTEQLLTELGFEQKNLVDKINAAAPSGSQLRMILNACRLAGNEFVHAGTLEELDKTHLQPEVVADALSRFINQVVLQLISIPREAEAINEQFAPHRRDKN